MKTITFSVPDSIADLVQGEVNDLEEVTLDEKTMVLFYMAIDDSIEEKMYDDVKEHMRIHYPNLYKIGISED